MCFLIFDSESFRKEMIEPRIQVIKVDQQWMRYFLYVPHQNKFEFVHRIWWTNLDKYLSIYKIIYSPLSLYKVLWIQDVHISLIGHNSELTLQSFKFHLFFSQSIIFPLSLWWVWIVGCSRLCAESGHFGCFSEIHAFINLLIIPGVPLPPTHGVVLTPAAHKIHDQLWINWAEKFETN